MINFLKFINAVQNWLLFFMNSVRKSGVYILRTNINESFIGLGRKRKTASHIETKPIESSNQVFYGTSVLNIDVILPVHIQSG